MVNTWFLEKWSELLATGRLPDQVTVSMATLTASTMMKRRGPQSVCVLTEVRTVSSLACSNLVYCKEVELIMDIARDSHVKYGEFWQR